MYTIHNVNYHFAWCPKPRRTAGIADLAALRSAQYRHATLELIDDSPSQSRLPHRSAYQSANLASARPRCEMAFFASASISANVSP